LPQPGSGGVYALSYTPEEVRRRFERFKPNDVIGRNDVIQIKLPFAFLRQLITSIT
jgi:hypothetical protein